MCPKYKQYKCLSKLKDGDLVNFTSLYGSPFSGKFLMFDDVFCRDCNLVCFVPYLSLNDQKDLLSKSDVITSIIKHK